MTKIIDISSLDDDTKKKIKALGKRSKEIQKGVSESILSKFKPTIMSKLCGTKVIIVS